MSSKEEIEKAREFMNNIKQTIQENNMLFEEENITIKAGKTTAQNIETLLQYIDQLEQENNKQNKIIDEMIKYIADVDTDIFCDTDKYERDIEDNVIGCDEDCEECVKYYFEKKVEEK